MNGTHLSVARGTVNSITSAGSDPAGTVPAGSCAR
jgi:hypothetical protein